MINSKFARSAKHEVQDRKIKLSGNNMLCFPSNRQRATISPVVMSFYDIFQEFYVIVLRLFLKYLRFRKRKRKEALHINFSLRWEPDEDLTVLSTEIQRQFLLSYLIPLSFITNLYTNESIYLICTVSIPLLFILLQRNFHEL